MCLHLLFNDFKIDIPLQEETIKETMSSVITRELYLIMVNPAKNEIAQFQDFYDAPQTKHRKCGLQF